MSLQEEVQNANKKTQDKSNAISQTLPICTESHDPSRKARFELVFPEAYSCDPNLKGSAQYQYCYIKVSLNWKFSNLFEA